MTSIKQQFIKDLFDFLRSRPYRLMKFTGDGSPIQIRDGEDLDLFIPQRQIRFLVDYLKKYPGVARLDFSSHQYHMHCYLFFADGEFLQIDLLWKLVRKQWCYLPEEKIWQDPVIQSNCFTYSRVTLLEHVLLFNFLNHSGLTPKYISFFQGLPSEQVQRLLDSLNDKFDIQIDDFRELAVYRPEIREKLIGYLKTLPENNIGHRVTREMGYTGKKVINMIRPRGRIITFSGVDGAGKSTILEDFKKVLSNDFRRKVVVLRHRPSLLPILSAWKYGKKKAEARVVASNPRQGKNQSILQSMVRFMYYLADYIVGRPYVWWKYLARDYVVLYDRYYFDFIADPRRSNLQLPKKISRWFFRFIQKADLNILLFAEKETILKRKKELSPEAIDQLTRDYRHLFAKLQSSDEGQYITICNTDREQTLKNILAQYIKIA